MNLETLNQKIIILQNKIKEDRLALKILIEQKNKLDPTVKKNQCPKCLKIFHKTRLKFLMLIYLL